MNQNSYAHGTTVFPLIGETISENLRNTVAKFPDNDALICVQQGYRATYQQFWEQIETVAKAFLAINVKKGDRVAICHNQIARYKTPQYWKFVDGFPMTITGKIRKVEMREQSIIELGLENVAKIKTS